MYQPPLCKNDQCGALVPPSRNPGIVRKFCSARCRRRYHSRLSYAREFGSGAQGGIQLHDGIAWFNRVIARNAMAGRKRLEEHNADCPFSKTGDGACPAEFDPYDKKRLCLIHAVLNEDWSQLMAAEDSLPFERKLTTVDGHWLTDMPDGGKVVGRTVLTPAERDALIDAGAARP